MNECVSLHIKQIFQISSYYFKNVNIIKCILDSYWYGHINIENI